VIVTTGGGLPPTVTVKLHVEVFPAASVAVQVTVEHPGGKVEPEAGEKVIVAPGQLSVTSPV